MPHPFKLISLRKIRPIFRKRTGIRSMFRKHPAEVLQLKEASTRRGKHLAILYGKLLF